MNNAARILLSISIALVVGGCGDKSAQAPDTATAESAAAPAPAPSYPVGLSRIVATDKLPTQVGTRVDAKLVSNGSAGYLLFGPYARLQAGTYNLLVKGDVETLPEGGKVIVDVAAARGAKVLGQQDVTDIGALPSFDIEVPADTSDIEVRVRVPADAKVSVEAYQLVKKA